MLPPPAAAAAAARLQRSERRFRASSALARVNTATAAREQLGKRLHEVACVTEAGYGQSGDPSWCASASAHRSLAAGTTGRARGKSGCGAGHQHPRRPIGAAVPTGRVAEMPHTGCAGGPNPMSRWPPPAGRLGAAFRPPVARLPQILDSASWVKCRARGNLTGMLCSGCSGRQPQRARLPLAFGAGTAVGARCAGQYTRQTMVRNSEQHAAYTLNCSDSNGLKGSVRCECRAMVPAQARHAVGAAGGGGAFPTPSPPLVTLLML